MPVPLANGLGLSFICRITPAEERSSLIGPLSAGDWVVASNYADRKAMEEGRRALILELAHEFPQASVYEIGLAAALWNPEKAASYLRNSIFWPRSLGSDDDFNVTLVKEMRAFLK